MNKRVSSFIIFCIISAMLFVGLGVWQIQRLNWKKELIRNIEYSTRLSAIEFPVKNASEVISEFRKVKVKGKYLFDQEIFLYAKYHNEDIGSYLITPMLLNDMTVVLINRGWVPVISREKQSSVLIQRPEHEIEIEGIIRNGSNSPWFAPKNSPEENKWFWLDTKDLLPFYRKKNNSKVVRPVIIQATKEGFEGTYPIPLTTAYIIRNDHLEYAITWFSLALITLIMSVYYIKTEKK